MRFGLQAGSPDDLSSEFFLMIEAVAWANIRFSSFGVMGRVPLIAVLFQFQKRIAQFADVRFLLRYPTINSRILEKYFL